MSDIPRGLEDTPDKVGFIPDIELIIFIKDIKSNRIIREERINYSDKEARKWLGRLTYHAITRGYSVETMNSKDYVVKV